MTYAVIVCSGSIRPYFATLLRRFLPNVLVISYEEIPDDVTLRVESVVKL